MVIKQPIQANINIIIQTQRMQDSQTPTLKSRLASILQEVRSVKKQLNAVRAIHKKFTFQSILPRQLYRFSVNSSFNTTNSSKNLLTSKQTTQPLRFDDKENNPLLNNLAGNASASKNKERLFKHKKIYSELLEEEEVSNTTTSKQNLAIFKVKNQQIKDLKANVIKQLTQIKSMERRQQALRRASQKMKAYNSEQKKNYRQSLSKDKQRRAQQQSYKKPGLNNTLALDQSLLNSDITIQIPISLQRQKQKQSSLQHKTLKCRKGHQYYQGSVNLKDQPTGNGRLQICCNELALELGGQSIRDCEFYQGQFRDGLFHGFGTLSYKGGVKYVGEFRDGRRHGKGSVYYNGKTEIAKWENDNFVAIM